VTGNKDGVIVFYFKSYSVYRVLDQQQFEL